MGYRRSSAEEATINLTPMIDVVFLLVIFFMVGAKFTQEEGNIKVDVPGVGNLDAMTRGPDRKKIDVMSDGSIVFDNQQVSIGQLQPMLASAKANYPEMGVVVRGDPKLNLEVFTEVLQAVRQAGVSDLGIGVRMNR